jgi:hypothetical protein
MGSFRTAWRRVGSGDGVSFRELLGRKALILGEVGSGKSRLTAKLLEEAIGLGYSDRIAVMDLSPDIRLPSGEVVGAPLTRYLAIGPPINYMRPPVVRAPRLEGNSREEVLRLADENARAMTAIFNGYLGEAREILFINDVSLYLHRGGLELLLSALSKANTSVLNGYYGARLGEDRGSGISKRERALVEDLAGRMDMVIEVGSR